MRQLETKQQEEEGQLVWDNTTGARHGQHGRGQDGRGENSVKMVRDGAARVRQG